MPKSKKDLTAEDHMQALHPHEHKSKKVKPEGVLVSPLRIETLINCEGAGDRRGVKAVCQEIRELAQDQMPERFPR